MNLNMVACWYSPIQNFWANPFEVGAEKQKKSENKLPSWKKYYLSHFAFPWWKYMDYLGD